MTHSADAGSESDGRKAGMALSLPDTDPHTVDPFATLSSEKTETAAPRSLGARILDYSAHAAMIVGLIGFAWTVSDHVVSRPTAAQLEAKPKVASEPALPKRDELADLRQTTQQMAADVKALHTSLDRLRAAVGESKTPAQLRVLQAGLDDVKTGLASAKRETATQLSQLSGKLDTVASAPDSKMKQLVDRLGRLERTTVDTSATGSIPPAAGPAKTVPLPPSKQGAAKVPAKADAADEPAKPPVIKTWIVRDVYDGIALIESRRGTLEVVPGVSVPGAGVVKSIDRHGGGWTVTTTKGLLAFAGAPREERRAGARDLYRNYRYDF